MVTLVEGEIDHTRLTQSVMLPGCGGTVTFLGTVRDITGDVVTTGLIYEAFAPMAIKKMEEIEAEIRNRWPVGAVTMIHRLGRLNVAEISVGVAVSCPHRAQAFEACRYAIDRLKDVVPIWKKDLGPDERAEWVHPGKSE